ncbi:lytic transglycosylase domain-containing protein [Brucella pseudogrignonensis]|uniref:lytic transglycosylase domain-containing protein n=1 Tax=Brucella pseudogrignonensis TaxID=419475 RepID=UPI001E333059|nr:lytic transglycosylase domain-containing protein [Brucella pseudogrignonensis]MCD4512191.1 lytic transglycosylase domain-containing protein [Brucella pseudogrignonensis]
MGNRDGGPCAAVPAIMALLIAGTMIVMTPCAAMADPLTDDQYSARSVMAVASSDPWAAHIAEAAKRFAIPERWIRTVMAVESAGDMRALSNVGAMGLMQIMPATWEELRAKHGLGNDPYNARDNILAGAAYLRELHDRYGSIAAMLAAYNAGPGRYERHLTGERLPTETVEYVARVMAMIGADSGIAVPIRRHSNSSRDATAPIFNDRSIGHQHDVETDNDLPSERQTIADHPAFSPLSDGLFVKRREL